MLKRFHTYTDYFMKMSKFQLQRKNCAIEFTTF